MAGLAVWLAITADGDSTGVQRSLPGAWASAGDAARLDEGCGSGLVGAGSAGSAGLAGGTGAAGPSGCGCGCGCDCGCGSGCGSGSGMTGGSSATGPLMVSTPLFTVIS
ncbi:hypothetical protein D9M71_390370 [compost metagenome]